MFDRHSSPRPLASTMRPTRRWPWQKAHDRVEDQEPSMMPNANTSGWFSQFEGWKVAIIWGIVATSFSLIFNLVLLGVGLGRYVMDTGRGRLVVGDCAQVPAINTAFHIAINVISVLLLGASNSAMQCLSAPRRVDLDRLHAQGHAADIGLGGVRNLRFMTWGRRILWVMLLFSSVPLHLFYNSVVISTVTDFDWVGYLVTDDFVQGLSWNGTLVNAFNASSEKVAYLQSMAQSGGLQYMTPSECMSTFNDYPIFNYPSTLMVTNDVPYEDPASAGSILGVYKYNSTWFNITAAANLVSDGLTPGGNLSNIVHAASTPAPIGQWTTLWTNRSSNANATGEDIPPPDFSFVDYCLAERVEWLCSVDTLPGPQAVVCLFNIMKLITLFLILFCVHGQPLVTIGDAIASYLSSPEQTTHPKLEDKPTLKKRQSSLLNTSENLLRSSTRPRWFRGVSPRRWFIASILCVGYWIAGIIVVSYYSDGTLPPFSDDSSVTAPGDVNIAGFYYATTDGGLTAVSVLIANIFQLALSITYFQFNGVLTAMLLSREFTDFAWTRKSLRVSSPQGEQRRTYWLSIPFRFAIPLSISASLLHWLLSEAIFYEEHNELSGTINFGALNNTNLAPYLINQHDGTFTNITPLLVMVIVAALCVGVLLSLGFRRYPSGIPIVRSNSFAISRACHPYRDEPEDVLTKLQWGIRGYDAMGNQDVGFSSRVVEQVDARPEDTSVSGRELLGNPRALWRRIYPSRLPRAGGRSAASEAYLYERAPREVDIPPPTATTAAAAVRQDGFEMVDMDGGPDERFGAVGDEKHPAYRATQYR